MMGARVIKHGGHKYAVMFIYDFALEVRPCRGDAEIGAFPPKLLICELFEEEHSNYDPKLYKIKASTSIGNQSYDLLLNLTLSDLTANFKGANKTVLPICTDCREEGKSPIVHRPFGKSSKK